MTLRRIYIKDIINYVCVIMNVTFTIFMCIIIDLLKYINLYIKYNK